MFGYNLTTLIIILVIALLLFGPKRLPELGDSIGKAIKGFKKATEEEPDSLSHEAQASAPTADPKAAATQTCPQCHQDCPAGFAFCPYCGHRLKETPASEK